MSLSSLLQKKNDIRKNKEILTRIFQDLSLKCLLHVKIVRISRIM